MRPRKPGTKTGSGAVWGSGLDTMDTMETSNIQSNHKNVSGTQVTFWWGYGHEFFPLNTGLFQLSFYSFTFLCVRFRHWLLTHRLDETWALNCCECRSLFREEESDGFRSRLWQKKKYQDAKDSESWNFNTASEDFINRDGNWTFFNISRR